MTDVLGQFSRIVRDERRARRWSQERLAERAGLHRTFVSELERGCKNPTLVSAVKLANAFDMSLSDLIRKAECIIIPLNDATK